MKIRRLYSHFLFGGVMACSAVWLVRANSVPVVPLPPPPPPVTPTPDNLEWGLPEAKPRPKPVVDAAYLRAIKETAGMVNDPEARALAGKLGLDVLNLTWEDTGRFKGSSVGPNISDMTIQVGAKDPKTGEFKATCMPVIRFPNFSDRTCDIDPREFVLLVGNHVGSPLRRVSLYDFLHEPTAYLSKPASWKGQGVKTLFAPRDTRVLVSAQACFLPVPKSGVASFNPVLFNYQSRAGDPAVLTILVTREGSSVTVIDNERDAFAVGSMWGQRLFHNANGQRASLTGQRLTDFKQDNPDTVPVSEGEKASRKGLDMVLLIQIPLKQKMPPARNFLSGAAPAASADMVFVSKAGEKARGGGRVSDVETAVIGHGDEEGPFTEVGDLAIERDPRYPVRVTVQFYKATSNGVVNSTNLGEIKSQIDRVYSHSDEVGSLVTDGTTGRATEYDGAKVQPHDWWEGFWQQYEKDTGLKREEAIRRLRRLLGENFEQAPVCDLYLRQALKKG